MSSRSTSTAFTLIEMLLALTLTAVLLTIVSVTIGAVARDSERLESMRAEPLWLESVVEVLRRDLRQSDTYQMTDGILTLHSHAGIVGNHDPVTIEYEVLSLEDTHWLVRRVSALDATPRTEPTVELLCGGVKDWQITMHSEDGEGAIPGQSREAPLATTSLDPSKMAPIPDQVTVSFTLVPSKTSQPSARRDVSPPDNRSSSNLLTHEHLIVVR